MLADTYENFCHIFAIYDVCQSDMERMPELLAIRGKYEGFLSDSDGFYNSDN